MKTCLSYRRVSVPLEGNGQVAVTDLTTDPSTYTYAELYRINPACKVWLITLTLLRVYHQCLTYGQHHVHT